MASNRQSLWYGQQRVDVAHLRSIESGVAGDLDLLAGNIMGGQKPLIVKGFQAVTSGAVGGPATALQIATAGSLLIHFLASESGSIFSVPSDRTIETLSSSNTRINGGFTASAVNYVGIDLKRSADATTTDTVKFIKTLTNTEIATRVPLARTLDYVFVISTADFDSTPTVCPIAKVVTDSTNSVVNIEDARYMLGRLAAGGSVPNTQSAYGWPGGRSESGLWTDGDKSIASLKDWMDAAMSRIWEVGGGERWFSPTADRNVQLLRTGSTFTNNDWFEWTGTNLHWQGLKIVFDNSTGWYNTIADQTSDSSGLTDLADGDCIYVDLVRTSNASVTGKKAPISTLGASTVPGSRHIIAYRAGSFIFAKGATFPIGQSFPVATSSALGIVELTYAAGNPSVPKVAPQDANGVISNTATAGNNAGFVGTGVGSGAGVKGTGGATNGAGVAGTGTGTGAGVSGTGGATNGIGVNGAGTGSGVGVQGTGGATGDGIYGVGGASGANGVRGDGTNGGNGVVGNGNVAGIGVLGTGGTSGIGVKGVGKGTAAGIEGHNQTGVGYGVYGISSGTSGVNGESTDTGGSPGVSGSNVQNNGIGVKGTGGPNGYGGYFIADSIATPAIKSDGYVKLNPVYSPASTDNIPNLLTCKSFSKVWGNIVTGGSGVVNDGVGIASVTSSGTANWYKVNFAGNFADTNYAVSINYYGSNDQVTVRVKNKQVGYFEFSAVDNSLVEFNLHTTALTFDFFVFGNQ